MILPQFIEFDIFLKTLERGMAGELLQPRDVHTLRHTARDRPPAQAVSGESRTVETGPLGPFLDDEGNRVGVNRVGTNPVAVGYRLSFGALAQARRRQTPQPTEQGPLAELGRDEPRVEGGDRTEIGLPGG
jgi:hypothetical protein